MVLYAAIAATRDERLYEAAILRTLGASRRQILLSQFAEFAGIGLLAGLIAAGGASRHGICAEQQGVSPGVRLQSMDLGRRGWAWADWEWRWRDCWAPAAYWISRRCVSSAKQREKLFFAFRRGYSGLWEDENIT